MDFFEAQARAKTRSKRLVFLFALAVVGTILAGYASLMLFANQRETFNRRGHSAYYYNDASPSPLSRWWDAKTFLLTTGGTLAVVGFASLYKWSQMRSGGPAVAEMVGGRRVDLKTTDLRERQLLNVVEEMAIASGIPVPAVYVLDEEPGLNAFAAGLATSDAAVAVTRGTLEKLTRDELQGVVAHEFSHILNGDMRLNVRITAIVFGILVIGLIGRGMLQSIGRGRLVRSGGGKKDNSFAILLGIGLALMIIGYVGYFFGRLIQAAVSRQREFLADASAVQFTRNPTGITGALKKIGGYALGGTIVNGHAAELGHFFFSQSFKSNFGGLWATHPSLDERIRAVEPTWDGKLFEPPAVVDLSTESSAIAGFQRGPRYTPDETARRVYQAPASVPPRLPVKPIAFKPAVIVADIGALTDAHFRHAQALLEAMPASLREATHEAGSAQILVYGLLLAGDRASRDAQQQLVAQHAGAAAAAALELQRPALSLLEPAARLPLLQLALPALRALDPGALDRFVTTLDELVHADGKVTPFEYALQKILIHHLRHAAAPHARVDFHSFAALGNDISVVLSYFAQTSSADLAHAQRAFSAGAVQLKLIADQLKFTALAHLDLARFDQSLDRLAASSLAIKQGVLTAAAHTIGADGSVTVEEGELFRALAAALDCPMPVLSAA